MFKVVIAIPKNVYISFTSIVELCLLKYQLKCVNLLGLQWLAWMCHFWARIFVSVKWSASVFLASFATNSFVVQMKLFWISIEKHVTCHLSWKNTHWLSERLPIELKHNILKRLKFWSICSLKYLFWNICSFLCAFPQIPSVISAENSIVAKVARSSVRNDFFQKISSEFRHQHLIQHKYWLENFKIYHCNVIPK